MISGKAVGAKVFFVLFLYRLGQGSHPVLAASGRLASVPLAVGPAQRAAKGTLRRVECGLSIQDSVPRRSPATQRRRGSGSA